MDDALGSPVELRRDRLGQRRNLSNVHMRGLLSDTVAPPAPHIRPVPVQCGTSWLLDKETIFDSVRNFAPRYAFSLVLALTPVGHRNSTTALRLQKVPEPSWATDSER